MVIEQKFKAGEEPDPTEYLYVSMEQKRIDQTKPYDPKKACWVPDDKEAYVQGEIKSVSGDNTVVGLPSHEEKTFKTSLVGQVNPPKYEKAEDMSNLTYLNDASVLHNLRQRYYAKLIYTYSGLFCIAVNPYKRYPIYTQRAMNIYAGKRRNEVPPHIFAIAEGAYQNMCQDGENQSILITGESGAGKTENTKKVIAYFASVGASSKKVEAAAKKQSLEDQIVQTNPVLEAFGNAKTTRNDNSSRFGKFIRIHFGPSGKLAGADIETYLLEKARVISQQPLERSYHIFYQLMSGKVPGIKEMCLLGNDIYEYHYVSQGKITVPGIDDGEESVLAHEAFEILGFSSEQRENIYKITASVMHMGEMKFKQKGREEQAEPDGLVEGERAGKLLGINGEDLYKNITKPRIKVGTEFVTKGQNKDQCCYTVGAMGKAMFDRLFKFLVKMCNDTLDTKQKRSTFAGVLDIAGFEIFDYNGFEQLCINFTNEKLQQFFNHHMFVLEQEEYKTEGLDWIFEDFGMDLQACIELMEKPMGIMAILEEQSMFPKATDQSFADMLKTNHLGKSNIFIKPKPPKPGNPEAHFSLVHYAGTVPYSITGWLEKNKDPLNDTVVDQFKKGSNALLCDIFADHPGQSAPPEPQSAKGGKKKGSGFATVSSSYREQLNNLMTTLKATHPHFIRCIIPNEVKTPGLIDAGLVMHQLTCNGVLEGIRICRKGFPNRMLYPDFKHRYLVLASAQMQAEKDDKKMAIACFNNVALDKEKYRVGHTKVFFRAGVLGELEEIRDERVSKLIIWLQSSIRNFLTRKEFKRLQEQRIALQVIQRNIRGYMKLRTWAWFSLLQKIKPLLGASKIGDELKKLQEKADEAAAAFKKEEDLRKSLEEKNEQLLQQQKELEAQLEKEAGSMKDFNERLSKLNSQREDLESELNEAQRKLTQEEEARQRLIPENKKLEQELQSCKRDFEDLELELNKTENDVKTKDHTIRTLNDEITSQDAMINKLNKEKKTFQESGGKLSEDLQAEENKVNHLNKVKAKLEQTMEELEDTLEREKKLRAEIEKGKRKVEGDLKLTQEAVGDLERNRKELEGSLQRKDKEISMLSIKLEEEQGGVSKMNRAIKEVQARIEELEEELEAERQGRAKAEKQKSDLERDIRDIGERLEEAGGATSAQIELNKKREAETSKLRRDLEEANIQHEASMASMRQKNNQAIAEMAEQIDALHKLKAKAEKERAGLSAELNDIRAAMDHLANEKASEEKVVKGLQGQVGELQGRIEEVERSLGDLENSKRKIGLENSDLSRQLEETNSQISQLNKLKVSLSAQLDEAKRAADEEARERSNILGKFRNVERDLDNLREQLGEEGERKSELHRQLQKTNGEAQFWRNKWESEGLAKAEELEETKRKLQVRLTEAEETIESLNRKLLGLEKTKQKLSGDLEEAQAECDRARQMAAAIEKRQKAFDKVVGDYKSKVDSLASELDATQRDCRNYSTELFRIKSLSDELNEQLDGVRRENKNLGDEVKDLMDQIGEGGRSVHEVSKARKRLQDEKDELQAALEEAESALEQEENKVLRGQLELTQVRQEIERRIQEKEEEFENTRRCHARELESMQASLEAECKSKAEALRMKKKLENDTSELELALDHSNKANAEAQRTLANYKQQMKSLQQELEDEHRATDEIREALELSERRSNALTAELEESRALLESADRARRNAESELGAAHDDINSLTAQAASLSANKRKLEGELSTLHADLEEILNEARGSEEKAKKAMVDAARLADELRAEQEHASGQEKARKALEMQMKEIQGRLETVEGSAIREGKKAIAKLEERARHLEAELDSETRRHADGQKNMRKTERSIRELTTQADEEKKNHERMQDLVDKLQQKIKTYKRQIEEAEEIAALNLAKYRKVQQDLEEAEERSNMAEQSLSRMRARTAGSPSRV